MNQQTISRLAIILLALVMAVFGIYHFIAPENLIGYLPLFMPKSNVWVYIPGAAFILAAIAFISNKMVKTAAYLLAALLIIFVLTIHLPKAIEKGDTSMLLKDIALAASAFFIGSKS